MLQNNSSLGCICHFLSIFDFGLSEVRFSKLDLRLTWMVLLEFVMVVVSQNSNTSPVVWSWYCTLSQQLQQLNTSVLFPLVWSDLKPLFIVCRSLDLSKGRCDFSDVCSMKYCLWCGLNLMLCRFFYASSMLQTVSIRSCITRSYSCRKICVFQFSL